MNYMEYNTAYQKIMLKVLLNRGISIKQRLLNLINTTDRQDVLKLYLQNNDFDGQIAFNNELLEDFENDEEFKELIELDTGIILSLKERAQSRLTQLEEQNKNTRQEEYEEQNNEEQNNEEQDEHFKKSHNSRIERLTKDNNLEFDQETQHIYCCEPMSMIQRDGAVLAMIKRSAISTINRIRDTQMNVNSNPSYQTLVFMAGSKNLYDNKIKQIAKSYIDMPECDDELRLLCEEMILAGEQVNETVDRHMAKYQDNLKAKSRDDGKDLKEEFQQQGDEEKTTENPEKPRNSWELSSPEEKSRIQISTKQVAQEHMEKQTNPSTVQEQPTIETSSDFDR